MNAAIRAVVRAALASGIEVSGIRDGYLGLHQDRIYDLHREDVSDIINRSGTILGTARFPAFVEQEVRKEAIEILGRHGIEGLVVIGGDGSYQGAKLLSFEGFPCVAIPGTIDNDIPGTDYTIGFSTALNNVVDAIDKLRDTASSHKRISLVETMGRHCGDLALYSSVASGAEFVIVPEKALSREELFKRVNEGLNQGKRHAIIVLCEKMIDINELASDLESHSGLEIRTTILGHVQRGGSPTVRDRVRATQMGSAAVHLLSQDIGNRVLIDLTIRLISELRSCRIIGQLYDTIRFFTLKKVDPAISILYFRCLTLFCQFLFFLGFVPDDSPDRSDLASQDTAGCFLFSFLFFQLFLRLLCFFGFLQSLLL
jgi:6-phosphofructokinase 1